MKLDIVICSNHETLDNLADLDAEMIRDAIAAGSQKCFDLTGQFPAEDSTFRNWHGGRHDQFRKRCGFVSICSEFAGTSLEDIAFEINAAIEAELDCAVVSC